MQFIFIGDARRDSDEFRELVRSVNGRSGDRVICLGERPVPSAEAETAWSLLRDTFEVRDFDDSLVFAE